MDDPGLTDPVMLRMREGKPGGGKGPLLSQDQSLTLATRATDALFVDAEDPVAFHPEFSNQAAPLEDATPPLEAHQGRASVAVWSETAQSRWGTGDAAGGTLTAHDAKDARHLVTGLDEEPDMLAEGSDAAYLTKTVGSITSGGGKAGQGYQAVFLPEPSHDVSNTLRARMGIGRAGSDDRGDGSTVYVMDPKPDPADEVATIPSLGHGGFRPSAEAAAGGHVFVDDGPDVPRAEDGTAATVTRAWDRTGGPAGDEAQNMVLEGEARHLNWQSGGTAARFGLRTDTDALTANQKPATFGQVDPVPEEDDELLPVGLDSARYKALGNAVCVPVAEWLGRRLAWVIAGKPAEPFQADRVLEIPEGVRWGKARPYGVVVIPGVATAIGLDTYNQASTGDVSVPLRVGTSPGRGDTASYAMIADDEDEEGTVDLGLLHPEEGES